MSFIAFAQEHVRKELPLIAPDVARSVSSNSFTLRLQYQGNTIVFLDNTGQPRVTYKVTRDSTLNHFLDNAVQCIKKSDSFNFSVQPLYDTGHFSDRSYMVSGWVRGTSLQLKKNIVSYDSPWLHKSIEHITQLHSLTVTNSPHQTSAIEKRATWWNDLLSTLQFLPASVHSSIDDTLSSFLASLEHMPLVLMHGDFVPSNVIQNQNGDLTMIDWELGLPQGPPLIDIVSLLLSYTFNLSGQGRLPSLCRCFLDSTSDADKCRAIINSYAERLQLPTRVLPVFIATTHIKLLAEDLHYLRLHHGPCSGSRILNDLLILEEFKERFNRFT